MPRSAILEWEGREYDHNPKDADWYWALGIVATAAAIASVLFANYLLAVLIVIAAAAIALHAAKVPPVHRFRLVDNGILIGEQLHPFVEMTSFSVLEDIEGEFAPMISIKTKNWHSPHLIIPLEGVDVDLIYAYFLHHVEEAEHPPTVVDLVAAMLGF